MLLYLKKFLLSPYYLYKSIQNIKTSVNTNPIIDKVEISPQETEAPEISYEILYKECQRELATLQEHLKQNIENHQVQLQEVADNKDAEIGHNKQEAKYTIEIVKQENLKLEKEQNELKSRYEGVTLEMENLIRQHNNDALEIKKLTEKSKCLKEELNQATTAKAHLEAETLALADRLTHEQKTIEESHKQYVKRYNYMSHNESQALKQERDQLQKIVEKSDKNIAIIKNELNILYKKDVGISKKLVAYLEDLKQIEKTIV